MIRTCTLLALLCGLLIAIGCGNGGSESVVAVQDSTAAPVQQTDGHQVLHTQDGGRMEGTLVGGKRTGAWVAFFPGGGIRSKANYSEGLEEGPTEVYHENGMTYYTGQYTHGRSVGEWVFYDLHGKELKRVKYDDQGEELR